MPRLVCEALKQARACQELAPKRAVWLVLALLLPQVPAYVLSTSPSPDKAVPFFKWLEQEAERLFHGAYGGFDSPINEFVAAAQLKYNSL